MIEVSDDSTESNKEEGEKGLLATHLSIVSKQGKVFRDQANPNLVYLAIDTNNNANDNAYAYSKQFKGLCQCGQWGHKRSDCPSKKVVEKQDDGPKPKCIHCGSYYHGSKFFWELEENAGNRPPDWKSRLGKRSAIQNPQDTQFYGNLQPILLCNPCGSPTHASQDFPVKKAKQEQKHVDFHTKHSDDSDDNKSNSDLESINSAMSGELGCMVEIVDEDEDSANELDKGHTEEMNDQDKLNLLIKKVTELKR